MDLEPEHIPGKSCCTPDNSGGPQQIFSQKTPQLMFSKQRETKNYFTLKITWIQIFFIELQT